MAARNRRTPKKKIRVTLDLSESDYYALKQLEEILEATSHAEAIRQAIKEVKHIRDLVKDGCKIKVVKDVGGRIEEKTLVFLPL